MSSNYGHHQHGGHGVQVGSGGDGQSLAQVMGLDHGGHHGGHNFLSHLLGLDHDAHAHMSHGHAQGHVPGAQHDGPQNPVHALPSQSVGWNSAVQGLKLSDALQGINVTPNFLFLLLFTGLFLWLFVIYWIRHNEPLANHVLGATNFGSATAAADRRLMEGARNAVPYRTSATTGQVYVPNEPVIAIPIDPSIPKPQPAPLPPQPQPKPTPLSAREAFFQDASNPPQGIGAPAPTYQPMYEPAMQGNVLRVPAPQVPSPQAASLPQPYLSAPPLLPAPPQMAPAAGDSYYSYPPAAYQGLPQAPEALRRPASMIPESATYGTRLRTMVSR
jgi:hypothetical protein